MVDETNSQVNASTVETADDGYEYEYIELAEGEELPEGAEYEYEYVEVPVEGEEQSLSDAIISDVNRDEISENVSADAYLQDQNISAENVVYEPVNEEVNLQNEIVEEPHFEIEEPSGNLNEDESIPNFDFSTEKSAIDNTKIPDFLSEPHNEEIRLDDILDDDSPLINVHPKQEENSFDDDFEKELFGTPAPDLHLDEIETNELKLGESLSEQNSVSFAVNSDVQNITETAPEPEVVPEPVVEEREENFEPEGVREEVVANTETTPEPEVVPEPVVEEREEVIEPEGVREEVVANTETAPEPEVAPEPVVEETQAAFEQSSVREEILSPENILPQSSDYHFQQNEQRENVQENKTEQVSVSGLEEEVPVIQAPTAALKEPENFSPVVFQQTEEIPVEVKIYDMSEEDYQSLCSVAFPFNKNSGFRGFQADEKVYNLVLEDIDYEDHEENDWSLIIFDDYRIRLNPNEKELVLPKGDNTVRYAKIMKSGKTKLELFNEEKYNFMAPTEDFAKIRGHYIYGNIANNSKLIVKDFVNISVADKLGKQITFNKPVSGLLTGPKASKLYFCDVRSIIIPNAIQMHKDEEKERAKAARWYSGSSDDKCFEFDAKSQVSEFKGTEECKIIHVNVGISHYGWNITFNNGLFMSFRDLLEYQTRYGRLPDNSGVITHGQQTLKFANIEKIIIYEAAQYFTYG